MVSEPNDIILRTGFVTTVHQSWVPRKMRSSNLTSGRPNFVRILDGSARLEYTRPLMFQFSTRIGMASMHFLLFSWTWNLWEWVFYFSYLPDLSIKWHSLSSMLPSFVGLGLESYSWMATLFIPKLKRWPWFITSATSHLVRSLRVLYWYVIVYCY